MQTNYGNKKCASSSIQVQMKPTCSSGPGFIYFPSLCQIWDTTIPKHMETHSLGHSSRIPGHWKNEVKSMFHASTISRNTNLNVDTRTNPGLTWRLYMAQVITDLLKSSISFETGQFGDGVMIVNILLLSSFPFLWKIVCWPELKMFYPEEIVTV
jgi:hypothetical protein